MTRAKVSHYTTLAPAAKFNESRRLLPRGSKSLYSPLRSRKLLPLQNFKLDSYPLLTYHTATVVQSGLKWRCI
jgi:hypothetical protein